jgi:hypothetical protein
MRLGLVQPPFVRGPERGLDLGPGRRDVGSEQDQVAHLVDERSDRRDERDRWSGHRRGRRPPNDRLDDLTGVPGDRHVEVDVEARGTDPVRVEADVVGAPAELLDPDRADGLAFELPAEEADLAARKHSLGGLHVLERGLDREQRRHAKVRKESEE